MTYYYYWRSIHQAEFLHTVERESPDVKILLLGRANLILERLQRDGKAPILPLVSVDIDTDWQHHGLYPFTPDPNGSYIRIHDRTNLIPSPKTSPAQTQPNLRKRSNPYSSLLPTNKRAKPAL